MNPKLTIQERLRDLRGSQKLEEVAQAIGISKSALGSYENNEHKDISPFAIVKLAEYYGVSTDYLLGVTETKNHPNTELHALHLSDDMIDLLTSGRINNRLLCEMATHPMFRQMLIDIEVCVDRIADMRVREMNQVLEATRRQVLEKYPQAEGDVYTRTLKLAQVQEDMFFAHVFHEEMDAIVRDIRKAHENDRTTADSLIDRPATTEEVKTMMEAALAYNGTLDQQRAHLMCSAMRVDFDKLTSEEKKVFAKVAKMSLTWKTLIPQRGKGMTIK